MPSIRKLRYVQKVSAVVWGVCMVRQHEIQQVHVCFRQKNGIEPLTETTVYPDTIWRERKRNGEIKKEGRRGKKERETVLHPSKYILQTTKHFSEATIRGQALSQDHPFSTPQKSSRRQDPHRCHKGSVIWSLNMQI